MENWACALSEPVIMTSKSNLCIMAGIFGQAFLSPRYYPTGKMP
jgi:hypothetical protein